MLKWDNNQEHWQYIYVLNSRKHYCYCQIYTMFLTNKVSLRLMNNNYLCHTNAIALIAFTVLQWQIRPNSLGLKNERGYLIGWTANWCHSNAHTERVRKNTTIINVIPENVPTFETRAKYQIRYSDVMMLVNFIGSSEQYKGHINSNHLWAEI